MGSRLTFSDVYDFIKQPIPLLVIAIVLGFIGVYYFTPLLLFCEIALIYDFYRFGRDGNRQWSKLYYVIFIGITSSVLFVAQYLVAHAQPTKGAEERVVSEIEYIAFEQISARFYQDPPVAYKRVNTMVYVNVTNLLGRPISVRDWSVSVMVNNKWIQLDNSLSGAFEPYAFGMLYSDKIVRFDLRMNGFDYVMRERQLGANENFEGWLFFNSKVSLTKADEKKVQKSEITLVDSAGEKYKWVSDVHSRGIEIPARLRFLPPEPIPQRMDEMPLNP